MSFIYFTNFVWQTQKTLFPWLIISCHNINLLYTFKRNFCFKKYISSKIDLAKKTEIRWVYEKGNILFTIAKCSRNQIENSEKTIFKNCECKQLNQFVNRFSEHIELNFPFNSRFVPDIRNWQFSFWFTF